MPERNQFWTCIKLNQLTTEDVPTSQKKKNWIPNAQTVETVKPNEEEAPKQPLLLEPQKHVVFCSCDKDEKKYHQHVITLQNAPEEVKVYNRHP